MYALRQKLAKQERPLPQKKNFSQKSKAKLPAKCKHHACCYIRRKLHLSGDVELNPGLSIVTSNQNNRLVFVMINAYA